MRFFDKVKSVLSSGSSGPSTKRLEEIPIMNEKWIASEFEFPFPDSIFSQLSKVSSKENPTRNEVVMGFIALSLGKMGQIKKLACLVNKETDPPTILLRFPDRSEGDEELEGKIIYKDANTSGDEYRFTPIEAVKYQDCFHSIERTLLTIFGLKDIQTPDMVEFYFEKLDGQEELNEKELGEKNLMVERTDNISYFNYPLKKRAELFSKHKEPERWLAENLFGESFKELIDFVMEKENTPHMELYCSKFRKLLEKYNIDY